ncbi:MAG: universal stress protein [Deltaproteobacteria bacterium]|jgi:universal stress protein A
MHDINRILVVSKSTKHCQKAVHYGISLAKSYDAKLYVIHVIHNPFGLEGWNLPIAFLPALEKEYRKMIQDAKGDMDRIIDSERVKGMSIEDTVIEGEPRKEIFKFIEEKNIDLLVMSAYKQWYLEHLLFGREIDEIVRTMPCSVLLVQKKLYAAPE